ncbi:MAG: uroporphyrinogen-III C-methyltransferase [Dehalococcoidia bacterium]|nr:uroporphyrinogen-III C-methyltransferase [Dehalococcoidia bacterium]
MPLKKGKVYLVGAGPGDPGLFTLKGVECMAGADVVVYDHLINNLILDHAPAAAEKTYVGKRGGSYHVGQDEISQLLVRLARGGKTVVRLKGGDPYILGRGSEEAAALGAAGIAFEVVPGISSAVAVPAYAGIPVTQRGLSSSLTIVTGHEDPTKHGSHIRWDMLAKMSGTLVILMGMQNLHLITALLLKYGMKPVTPVAVIRDGTLPTQFTITGTLKNIAQKAAKAGLTAPAVVVIGRVVEMRRDLRWFEMFPLFGKRVLVTRAGIQAGGLERLLIQHGAQPVRFSSIQICPIRAKHKLDRSISHLHEYDWLAFTSANGVQAFFHRMSEMQTDSRALAGLRIGAIGPMTARALNAYGITADYIPAVHTGKGFLRDLTEADINGKRFLLPRADIADDELTQGLRKLGARVDDIAVYHTISPRRNLARLKDLLLPGNLDVIMFTSSSTVTNLLVGLSDKEIKQIEAKIACIGPKTAATAKKSGLKVDILAKEQTMAGLIEALEKHFRKEA